MHLVLQLPGFPLQALRRWRDDPPDLPLAVTDPVGHRHPVLAVNGAAWRAGVRPGQAAVQALARCSGVVLLSRDVRQEKSAMQALLQAGAMFSPEVEATSAGVVTVGLGRSRERDWEALGARAVEAMRACLLEARAGLGPNPDLALLASRRARPVLVVTEPSVFLRRIALRDLGPPSGLLAVLEGWGVRTAGQLTALPYAETADRLGPEAARLWELAAGRVERPLRCEVGEVEYREGMDFEHPVETLEPLLFVVRRFLDQLTLRLRATWRVAGVMRLTILVEGGEPVERTFTVPSPSADAGLLFRILHTHLETLRLERGPSGVVLELFPGVAEETQFQLFESALRDPNRFGETMARLLALTGEGRAGVAVVEDSHRPDRWRMEAPAFQRVVGVREAERDMTSGLPLHRFRPPMPVRVVVEGWRPVRVESAAVRGRVVESRGPWRLSGQWWEAGGGWRCEEWEVAMVDGSLWRLRREEGEWYVDGCMESAVVRSGEGMWA